MEAYLNTDLSLIDPAKVVIQSISRATDVQHKELCVICLPGEPTLSVFVGVGDVQPLVEVDRLGGDILTDFISVRPDLHV